MPTSLNDQSPPQPNPLESDAGLQSISDESLNGVLEISDSQSVAQTFTVPSDGVITGVEILSCSRHRACQFQEDLTFRLKATDKGFPGDLNFSVVVVPHLGIMVGDGNLRIDLWEDLTVGAFQTLALQLSTEQDGAEGCLYGWNGSWMGEYPGGQSFTRSGEAES